MTGNLAGIVIEVIAVIEEETLTARAEIVIGIVTVTVTVIEIKINLTATTRGVAIGLVLGQESAPEITIATGSLF